MHLAARQTRTAPALLAFCLILLGQASAFNLTVDDLPDTKQRTNRLLATIVVGENVTNYFITKQLWNYAQACEAGFEVHVVLITFPTVWDNADSIVYPTPSRYYCLRLQMLLPVAVAVDLPDGLTHQHRHLFSKFVHKYDLFLSQEHDMDVKARHLLYWTHWRQYFMTHPSVPASNKTIIPGFLRHEVSMRKLDNKLWHHPAAILHFSALISVIDIGNVTCFAPHKTYAGLYLIDRPMLLLAMSKQAWKTDAKKDYNEINVHHQSAWQWYYFHQAIPMTDIDAAMVHHGSDRYTPDMIEQSSRASDSQFRPASLDGFDIVELDFMITNCMGQHWDGSKLPFPYPSLQGSNAVVGYGHCSGWGLFKSQWFPKWLQGRSACQGFNPDPKGGKGLTPCAECASRGKGSIFNYKMSGPTLAAQPMKPKALFLMEVSCIDALERQEIMPCKNKGCNDYHLNVTNSTEKAPRPKRSPFQRAGSSRNRKRNRNGPVLL